ncbi:hypothetical protein WA158_001000 [Blastocystis sp. Blastoise]
MSFSEASPALQPKIRQIISDVVGSSEYKQMDTKTWSDTICSQVQTILREALCEFKLITHVCIFQKKDAGMYVGSSSFWDNKNDGTCTVTYDNGNVFVIVTVYAIKL